MVKVYILVAQVAEDDYVPHVVTTTDPDHFDREYRFYEDLGGYISTQVIHINLPYGGEK